MQRGGWQTVCGSVTTPDSVFTRRTLRPRSMDIYFVDKTNAAFRQWHQARFRHGAVHRRRKLQEYSDE